MSMRYLNPTPFHSQLTSFISSVPLKPQPCFKRSFIHIILFSSNKNYTSEIRKQFALVCSGEQFGWGGKVSGLFGYRGAMFDCRLVIDRNVESVYIYLVPPGTCWDVI
jgi:hypothetical protein